MSKSKINFKDITQADLNHSDSQAYTNKHTIGLSENLVREISADKNEPNWMLQIRLQALKKFNEMPMPTWGPNLSNLDFNQIRYFATATEDSHAKSWDEVDPEIKQTFERLKIPEAERAVLAGVGAQYESENIYHNLKKQWLKKMN